MAAIDDLIDQVDDAALRRRLKEEADRLRRDKKFSYRACGEAPKALTGEGRR